MKEATGELNMTVITVVAIAAIGAFFLTFVWPNVKNNIREKTEATDLNLDTSRINIKLVSDSVR